MSEAHPRFIQIAVTHDTKDDPILYGLTAMGEVWRYVEDQSGWTKLSNKNLGW